MKGDALLSFQFLLELISSLVHTSLPWTVVWNKKKEKNGRERSESEEGASLFAKQLIVSEDKFERRKLRVNERKGGFLGTENNKRERDVVDQEV